MCNGLRLDYHWERSSNNSIVKGEGDFTPSYVMTEVSISGDGQAILLQVIIKEYRVLFCFSILFFSHASRY